MFASEYISCPFAVGDARHEKNIQESCQYKYGCYCQK
jgi:hypothetical protein